MRYTYREPLCIGPLSGQSRRMVGLVVSGSIPKPSNSKKFLDMIWVLILRYRTLEVRQGQWNSHSIPTVN